MKIWISILILFAGCKAIEQSRDRKALGRVLTSDELTAKVAKVLPPCANDTTIVTVDSVFEASDYVPSGKWEGIVDTTILLSPQSGTILIGPPSGAIYKPGVVYKPLDFDKTLSNGIRVTMKDGLLTASATIRVDSKTIVDQKLVDKWRDLYVMANDQAAKEKELAEKKAATLKADGDKWKGKAKTRLWVSVSAGLLAVAVIALWIISKVK